MSAADALTKALARGRMTELILLMGCTGDMQQHEQPAEIESGYDIAPYIAPLRRVSGS